MSLCLGEVPRSNQSFSYRLLQTNNPSSSFTIRLRFKYEWKKTINIYADTAKYNNKNYDSIFEKNVRVLFENHEILGERLNLDFGANLMTMSKDVIYKNPEAILKADRLVIDLITKSSKIFMDDTTKKVIAIYSN